MCVLQDCDDLQIFSVVTGSFSVLMVVLLIIIVIQLNITVRKLKKQMALQSRVDQHSYNNPTIQPHEELAVRGFSMFSGQEDKRAPNTPQRDDYPRNLNPKPQSPADRAPYMPGNDEFFGNFSNQPRQGRYAY